MRATKTMHVDAKPERVMSFFCDSTAVPKGMTMEVVHESPEVEGNSYEWTFKVLGIPSKGITVYTDYVPAERLEFRNFGVLEGTSAWTIEPEDGGSRVTVEVDGRLAIPLVGRLLDPILRREWEKELAWGRREMEKRLEIAEPTA